MELTVEAVVKMKVEVTKESWAGYQEAEDKTLNFLDQWIGDGAYDPAVIPGVDVKYFRVTDIG